jgi:hypothetical protein
LDGRIATLKEKGKRKRKKIATEKEPTQLVKEIGGWVG